MPELRKDPVIGRWVIVAAERARRPDQYATIPHEKIEEVPCPFDEGKEDQTPPEIYAIRRNGSERNKPGWELRVVPSKKPYLRVEGNLDRRGNGLYDIITGVGAHEIIIETNEHIANMADLSDERIAIVLKCYADRMRDLENDQRFKYVLVFKNYGWTAGSTRIRHARSHLIATPINPKRVKEELVGARQYYDCHERCVFCDIIRQEQEQKTRVVLETDGFIAVVPFAARFPFEVWILPKRHACDFVSISDDERSGLAGVMRKVLQKLKRGLNDPPYNYIIHTAPFRRQKAGYWKTIGEDYHWHIEMTPRLTRVAGFEWGTGCYICPVMPEAAAGFLRDVSIG